MGTVRISRLFLLVAIVAILAGSSALAAFLRDTITVEVDVEENIIILSPTMVELVMFPGEEEVVEVELRNIGSVDQPVEIDGSIVPDGIELFTPGLVTVFAGGEPQVFEVVLTAEGDIEPGSFVVELSIKREDD